MREEVADALELYHKINKLLEKKKIAWILFFPHKNKHIFLKYPLT